MLAAVEESSQPNNAAMDMEKIAIALIVCTSSLSLFKEYTQKILHNLHNLHINILLRSDWTGTASPASSLDFFP